MSDTIAHRPLVYGCWTLTMTKVLGLPTLTRVCIHSVSFTVTLVGILMCPCRWSVYLPPHPRGTESITPPRYQLANHKDAGPFFPLPPVPSPLYI